MASAAAATVNVEARDRGELASSAAIVPGRKDKGEGVYILRVFDVVTSRGDSPSGIARGRDTRARRPLYHLFQQRNTNDDRRYQLRRFTLANQLKVSSIPRMWLHNL